MAGSHRRTATHRGRGWALSEWPARSSHPVGTTSRPSLGSTYGRSCSGSWLPARCVWHRVARDRRESAPGACSCGSSLARDPVQSPKLKPAARQDSRSHRHREPRSRGRGAQAVARSCPGFCRMRNTGALSLHPRRGGSRRRDLLDQAAHTLGSSPRRAPQTRLCAPTCEASP